MRRPSSTPRQNANRLVVDGVGVLEQNDVDEIVTAEDLQNMQQEWERLLQFASNLDARIREEAHQQRPVSSEARPSPPAPEVKPNPPASQVRPFSPREQPTSAVPTQHHSAAVVSAPKAAGGLGMWLSSKFPKLTPQEKDTSPGRSSATPQTPHQTQGVVFYPPNLDPGVFAKWCLEHFGPTMGPALLESLSAEVPAEVDERTHHGSLGLPILSLDALLVAYTETKNAFMMHLVQRGVPQVTQQKFFLLLDEMKPMSFGYRLQCPRCSTRIAAPPSISWDCPKCPPGQKVWQPENDCRECTLCATEIGRFTRHHCRVCGRLVCSKCCTEQTISFMGAPVSRTKDPQASIAAAPTTPQSNSNNTAVKVCTECSNPATAFRRFAQTNYSIVSPSAARRARATLEGSRAFVRFLSENFGCVMGPKLYLQLVDVGMIGFNDLQSSSKCDSLSTLIVHLRRANFPEPSALKLFQIMNRHLVDQVGESLLPTSSWEQQKKIQVCGKYTLTCPRCHTCHHAPPSAWYCVTCLQTQRKKELVWQPDGDTLYCTVCEVAKIGRFFRHHCRRCGRLVCGKCSGNKRLLPDMGFKDKELVRVCFECVSWPDDIAMKEDQDEQLGKDEAPQPAAPPPAPTEPLECVVCMDGARTHACLPCGHLVLCSTCATGPNKLSTCPICRCRIAQISKIHV